MKIDILETVVNDSPVDVSAEIFDINEALNKFMIKTSTGKPSHDKVSEWKELLIKMKQDIIEASIDDIPLPEVVSEISALYDVLNQIPSGSAKPSQEKIARWRKLMVKYEKKLEPLLIPSTRVHVMLPTKYQVLFDLWRKHVRAFWTNDEVDYSKDLSDFNKLESADQHFILKILAFFAAVDGIVMENIDENFASEIQCPEGRAFYAFQGGMEAEHSFVYSHLLSILVPDVIKRNELLNAVATDPDIKAKAEWAKKYMGRDSPFVERLFAFVIIEGVFFSASFCGIFWLKKRGVLPGITFSNEMISRDEGLHVAFGIALLNLLDYGLPLQLAREMMMSAMIVELNYVRGATQTPMIGMNYEKMSQFVQSQSDLILKAANFGTIYNCSSPFPWMETILMQGKTNFFEKRVGDYQRSTVQQNPHMYSSSTLPDVVNVIIENVEDNQKNRRSRRNVDF